MFTALTFGAGKPRCMSSTGPYLRDSSPFIHGWSRETLSRYAASEGEYGHHAVMADVAHDVDVAPILRGRVVTRPEVLHPVWGETDTLNARRLELSGLRLRRALGCDLNDLKMGPGFGDRWADGSAYDHAPLVCA